MRSGVRGALSSTSCRQSQSSREISIVDAFGLDQTSSRSQVVQPAANRATAATSVRDMDLSSVIAIDRRSHRTPEHRIVAGKDAAFHEPRERLQPADGMEREGGIEDDAGHALVVEMLLPV